MTDPSGIIRAGVEAALPEQYRPMVDWAGPVERTWSWHFSVDGGGTRLLVKVPRWSGIDTLEDALAAGPQDDTAREFSALEAVAAAVAASGDAGLTAVRPVVYVPSVNSVVMEWLDAVPLRKRLGPFSSDGAALPLLAAAGRWIRINREASDWAATRFDGTVEADTWRGVTGVPGADSSIGAVAAAAERLDGALITVGTIHGDLSESNVLVTPDGRVAVIDPNGYRGRALTDVARLAGELVAGRSRLATFGMAPGSARAHRRVDALIGGYGAHDAEIFRYEMAAALARRWFDLEGRAGIAADLAAVAGRRLFRSEISRLVG